MADCPTDLGAPLPRVAPAPEPGLAGQFELDAMIWLAREIAAGRPVRARVPEATMLRAMATTVVKLAEDRG